MFLGGEVEAPVLEELALEAEAVRIADYENAGWTEGGGKLFQELLGIQNIFDHAGADDGVEEGGRQIQLLVDELKLDGKAVQRLPLGSADHRRGRVDTTDTVAILGEQSGDSAGAAAIIENVAATGDSRQSGG